MFQGEILETVNKISKTLQNPNLSLYEVCNLLNISLNELQRDFVKLMEDANEISSSWKIETLILRFFKQ